MNNISNNALNELSPSEYSNFTMTYHGHKKIDGFSDNRKIKQSRENRDNILKLQDEMLKMEPALDAFPVTHHFAPGVYGREMFLPANHTIIGKIHKHSHLNIISKGVVIVSTEDGSKELVGPCIFTSYAGTKRAVYVKEDTVWTTIHVTDETDLNKIEEFVIAKDFDELDFDKKDRLEGVE